MDFTLCIGIDNYLHLNKTPYAENDANGFYDVMKNVYNVDYSVLLLKDQATRTSILTNIEDISKRIDEKDRFILFFAGHGANINGNPHISCYDSNIKHPHTWINVLEIIEQVNSSGLQKSIYFIDACESTIKLGARRDISKFTIEELEKNAIENSYTSVYSSTSHKGVADVNSLAKHGIWTNYLLKAMSGEDEKALNDKYWLTNKSLQNYLSITVKAFCKSNPDVTVQNSFSWGKEEGEFIIRKFQKKEVAVYKTLPTKAVERVVFNSVAVEDVNNLTGYKKGSHNIPKYYNNTTNKFIKGISEEDISEHIEAVSKNLRGLFNLKARDFKLTIDDGAATFECPYFTYSYWVELNPNDLSEAIFTAELNPIDLETIIQNSSNLDKCFPQWFDNLVYYLPKAMKISELIDKIESLESDILNDYKVDYDSAKSFVTVSSKQLNRTIRIENNRLEIKFQVQETVPNMIEGLKAISNQLLLINTSYKLLG